MRDFFINESSFWKDQEGKDKFLSKQKKVTNEFWVNFLGFFALYSKYKDDNKLIQYFKQSTVRLEKVTDSDSDLMVIMKVIDDMHVIPDMVMMKITKLLAKIKNGALGGLDENLFRNEILKKIKITQLYPYPQISALVKDFNKGNKTLADMLPDIYALAMAHKRGHEFRVLYKRLSHIDDGTTSSTQTVDPVQQTVSPVKSALTGAPKPDPIPVRTQVIPDPTPVVRALTWDDILAHLGTNGLAPNKTNQLLSLMYIVSNCENEADITKFFAAFRTNSVSGKNLLFSDSTVIGDLLYGRISADIMTLFPSMGTLYTPINGDLTKLNTAFLEWIRSSTGALYHLHNFIQFSSMKDTDDFVYVPQGFSKLYNLIDGGFDSLITAKIPASKVTEIKSHLVTILRNSYITTPAIFIDQVYKSPATKKVIFGFGFENSGLKLFSYISDDFVKDDVDMSIFNAMLAYTAEDHKSLAKRFILLSDQGNAAYQWAKRNITLKDLVEENGLTVPILAKMLGKGLYENTYREFYKTLKDEGLDFKQFIEKYNLKYDDFLAEVRNNMVDIDLFMYFANYVFKERGISYSYLIKDLVFYAKEIKWIQTYAADYMNFFGFDALYMFATENMFTEFKELLERITTWSKDYYNMLYLGNLNSSYSFAKLLNEVIPDTSPYYIQLLKLIKYVSSTQIITLNFLTDFNVSPKFVYDNADFFITGYTYPHSILGHICKDQTLDLSKKPELDKVIIQYFNEKISSGYGDLASLGLNDITLQSYTDKILDILSKMDVMSKSVTIVKIVEYLLKRKMIDGAYVEAFYTKIFDDKDKLFTAVSALSWGSTNEQLSNYSITSLINTKDKVVDYLLGANTNKDKIYLINKYTSWGKKTTEQVASYLENNSFWIGKLYEEHGTDALVEYLSKPEIVGLWNGVTSGKRLLNNANSLELILLNMLSDPAKLKDIDKVLAAFPEKIERTLINTLKEQILIYPLLNDIYESNNPLKPHSKLTPARIKTLLKFNNFEFKGNLIRKKKNEPWSEYFGRLSKDFKASALIPDIKIAKIDETKDQLNEKTVEYSKYYNGMHGDSAVEFLESYNVSMKYPAYEQFKQRFGENNLIPAFHGSGLTASNFILRFGFTVIPATDSSTVGRMLDIKGMMLAKLKTDGEPIQNTNDYIEYIENGYFPYNSVQYKGSSLLTGKSNNDYWTHEINTVGGIYVSDVIEKVAQYLGDEGYSRKTGTIGTIYECEVNLGTPGLHYHSAGTGSDHIRSPEYALCWPQGQINIVRAHKVRFTTKSFVNSLKKKYPSAVQENKHFPKFADYLREQEVIKSKNVITFVFHQGLIPTGKEMIEWTDFEKKVIKKSTKMYLDSNQYGIGVVFNTDKELNGVIRVPFTDEFIVKDPEGLYSQFLNLLDECKG